MKLLWLVWLLIVFLMGAVLFWVGVLFEFEYPYAWTIRKAMAANTMAGKQARHVVAESLGVPASQVHWHRCSHCQNFDGNGAVGTVRVQVRNLQNNEIYFFAFDKKNNLLMPAGVVTADRFPSMGTNVASKPGE